MHLAQNRSVYVIYENLSTELTPLSQKIGILAGSYI